MGGNGIVREYEFTVPTQITIMSERRRFAPYGLLGGHQGKKGNNSLIRGKEKIQLGSKANLKANPGDRLLIETPGGGGYGQKK
jgi:N-methylhydantoinase B/oxoprolinase/acetone carboxylase alpha subunit